MTDQLYTTKSPIKIDGLNELAAQMPDNEWRELRVYFRKTDKFEAEVRIGQQLNMVKLGSQ